MAANGDFSLESVILAVKKSKQYTDQIAETLAGGLKYKGSVANKEALPLSGNELGHMYTTNDTGHEWVWTIKASSGTLDKWLDLSKDLENYYKKTEVDAIITTLKNEFQEKIDNKLDLMPGDEHTAGNAYNLPYYFYTVPSANKVEVHTNTVSLDGNKVYGDYSLDVNSATTTNAGLMSANDKTKLDGIDIAQYRKAVDQDEIDAKKYEKPNTGIPKSDLSDDVRQSLSKADTALQEHQDISGKANDNEVVKLTGNQSIDGSKEFKQSIHFESGTSSTLYGLDGVTQGNIIGSTKYIFPVVPNKESAIVAYTDYVNSGLANKQDTIDDLQTIRDGAALGATSIQSHQDISGKQDKLIAGKNITITDNVIKANSEFITLTGMSGTLTDEQLVTINDNTDAFISLNDRAFKFSSVVLRGGIIVTYSNSTATNGDVIIVNVGSKTWEYKTNQLQAKLTAGDNITIDANNVISASSGSSYSAGNGISINDNTISTKLGRGLKHTDDGEITIKPADTTISVGEFGVRVPYVSTSLDNTSSGLAVKLADNSIEAYNSGTGTKGIRVNTTVIQPKISDIETIRTNASNGATALSNMNGIKLLALTKAEYEALTTKDANTLYIIKKA